MILASISNAENTDKIPKLLIVSFGGLRWDYLKKYQDLKNFNYLKRIGSYSNYITNSFVSESVPNQWSIITGLEVRWHGMLQDEMYDREFDQEFIISAQKITKSNEWFGRNSTIEPLWVTNQKAEKNRKSLVKWAGGKYTWKEDPYRIDYQESEMYDELVDKIIRKLTKKQKPANFAAIHLDILNRIGHEDGPFSTEIKKQLHLIDKNFLGVLIERLKSEDLFEEMNLILTSDHGMTSVSKQKAIILDKYIETELISEAIGGPVIVNLFLKNSSDIQHIFERLSVIKNLTVYKNKQIPEKLRFSGNERSGDLVLIANYQYTIYLNEPSSYPKGANGYDGTKTSSMHSIFIAEGPAFKKNYKIDTFKNVDIYPLMCEVLKIKPQPNNGSFERVKSMLDKKLTSSQIKFYTFLSFVPVVLSIVCAIVLFFLTLRKGNKTGSGSNIGHGTSDGYNLLSMKDDLELISDSEDASESEIFTQI